MVLPATELPPLAYVRDVAVAERKRCRVSQMVFDLAPAGSRISPRYAGGTSNWRLIGRGDIHWLALDEDVSVILAVSPREVPVHLKRWLSRQA